jgi:hypothetical protein
MKMKTIIGTIALVALGVAFVLAPTPARAFCGTSVVFGQGQANCGGYCYVQSPGTGTNASIQATFWSLDAGNPAPAVGDDNGTYADNAWLQIFPGGLSLNGDWSAGATIDGCINNAGSTGKMVVALSDTDAAGNAYFAAVCNTRNPTVTVQFDQSILSPAGHIVLKTLPAAVVTGSVRVGTEATVTVASPNFASIYYSDASAGCAINNVFPQYDLWISQVARSGPAPPNHTQDGGGWQLRGTCAVGSPCSGTTTCATTNCDAFVAVSPHYNSNFSTGEAPGLSRVGANSTRFQAGPTLADPPKFKPIPKGQQKKLSN